MVSEQSIAKLLGKFPQVMVEDKKSSAQPKPISPIAASIMPAPTSVPPEYSATQEVAWKDALNNLDQQLVLYRESRKTPDDGARIQRERDVYDAMNNVADAHTDPKVRDHWKRKAEEFRKADDKGKDNMMKEVLKAVGTLLAAPFVLAGLILMSVGTVLKALGTVLTGGRYRKAFQ